MIVEVGGGSLIDIIVYFFLLSGGYWLMEGCGADDG